MLYLGIDLHSKQITVCVRNEAGKIILRHQVSTRPEKIKTFFDDLLAEDPEFMAIVEVCGFNDWLTAVLRERTCREIVIIHPEKTSKKKTDRRDANMLGELLWLNRTRLADGQRAQGLRRVYIPTEEERNGRQLTGLRKRLAQQRTRTLNKIHRILHNHNLMWDYPTKKLQTKKLQTKSGYRWLEKLLLPATDRVEMNLLLTQWKLWDEQLAEVDEQISQQAQARHSDEIHSSAELLATIPGISVYCPCDGSKTLAFRRIL